MPMREDDPDGFLGLVIMFVATLIALLFLLACFLRPAYAHDPEHHELNDWYEGLMQPDHPTARCCGERDAYWCDEVHVRDGKTYCTITDDREIDGRPEIPSGTEVFIPDYKLKWDRGNPTGHSILFGAPSRSYDADGSGHIDEVNVYCFVQNGGV